MLINDHVIYDLTVDREELLTILQTLEIRMENETDSETGELGSSDAVLCGKMALTIRGKLNNGDKPGIQ